MGGGGGGRPCLVQYSGQELGEGGVTGRGSLCAQPMLQAAKGQGPLLGQQCRMNGPRALDDPPPAGALLTGRLLGFVQHAHMPLSILQHHELLKYYESTSKPQPQALQNLTLCRHTRSFLSRVCRCL